MTDLKNDFTRETTPFTSVDEAVDVILEAWAKHNDNVLETAKRAAKANREFAGQQKELARRCGFSKSMFNKLVKIGNCKSLYYEKYGSILPIGLTPLWELSSIPNVDVILESEKITRKTTRDEIKALRKAQVADIQKRGDLLNILDGGPQQHLAGQAGKPVTKRRRTLKLPSKVFAVLDTPKDGQTMAAVLNLLDQIRAAGVEVIDRYTRERGQLEDDITKQTNAIPKYIDKEIRARIRAMKKDFARNNKKWMFYDDELELNGTEIRAREVLEILGRGDEYDSIKQTAEMKVPLRQRPETSLPHPEYPSIQPDQISIFPEKKRSPEDFADINFT